MRAISLRGLPLACILSALVATDVGSPRALAQVAESTVARAPAAKPEWLDGTGKDLRIRIAGEVLDENGKPAEDFTLGIQLRTQFATVNLPATLEKNRFQVWVPVGSVGWFSIHLSAASSDGHKFARETISSLLVRQAAIDGVKLAIKPPERFVFVRVVQNGEPVADASVTAEVAGAPFSDRTNGMGFARFPLQNRDHLSQLTAWTSDFRIGGYSFYRDPPRDPAGNRHSIELEMCRPQIVRLVTGEDRVPVPAIPFVLTVGTGAPNYQFIGKTPTCEMRTNDKGEAVYRWFPDWERHGSYIELLDPAWVKVGDAETVDGVVVVRIKKSRFADRKRVAGQVTSEEASLAGFSVEMWSFQGEEEHNSDVVYAFTDEQGRFEADYLPGATYCIAMNDARYVSNIIDLMVYDPTTDKSNPPSLKISKGAPVEVTVTSGPAREPVAYQWINVETPHPYSWREGNETRHGQGHRRWQIMTDEQGRARTYALAGEKVGARIYTPVWRAETSTNVTNDGIAKLEFHQKVADERKVVGRLLLAPGVEADLADAVLEVGSVDGETNGRLTCRADRRGQFEFYTRATQVGIFARTKDQKAAAVAVLNDLNQPLELTLQPTGELRGRLLGREDRPLKGHGVYARLHISGKGEGPRTFFSRFDAAIFSARTDDEGNYVLSGLPCPVPLSLSVDPFEGQDARSLGEVYLVPHDQRPPTISRLWTPEKKVVFGDRFEETLRDCRLSNYRAMVLLFRPADDTKQFVDGNFMRYRQTPEVASFMQLEVQVGPGASADVAAFTAAKNWPTPADGRVAALALDPEGRELGRIEIDSRDAAGPQQAADFIRKYAPPQVDAKERWDEAFATAKASGRKVWALIGQRYCGPCFSLTRWIDDQKALLGQDYVLLKIDNLRDLNGNEVARRLPDSEKHGIPFHAIFNPDGAVLITSEGPLGNVGYPSGIEDHRHLRKMLMETRGKLTEQQIDEIVKTLGD